YQIGDRAKLEGHFSPIWMREVQCDRALAHVLRGEEGCPAIGTLSRFSIGQPFGSNEASPIVNTSGRLDDDDLGTQRSEMSAREGPCPSSCQLEHAHPSKRSEVRGHFFPPSPESCNSDASCSNTNAEASEAPSLLSPVWAAHKFSWK